VLGGSKQMRMTKKGERIARSSNGVARDRVSAATDVSARRSYVPQGAVPAEPLSRAIRVAEALIECGSSASLMTLAKALNMTPSSGRFRTLAGAAMAFGLTDGGGFAERIAVLPRGAAAVRSPVDEQALAARKEALLTPRVVADFLRRFQSATFPKETIGCDVLGEMGIAPDRTKDVYALILESAEFAGVLTTIQGKRFVDLSGASAAIPPSDAPAAETNDVEDLEAPGAEVPLVVPMVAASTSSTPSPATGTAKRDADARRDLIYISHGTNKALLATIQKSLKIGGLQAVISVERATVSTSISAKVLREMRTCGGAIIHIDVEHRVALADGKERVILNENVLIEIGAAMALYGDRFILLVKDGIELPSNLKGSFEVRYKGEALDGDEAFRLLESLHDLKTHPLPGEGT
jgi:predicted nucleotide-binding protein